MVSSNSDSDQEKCPRKKLKIHENYSKQLSETLNLSNSSLFNKNVENPVLENSQNEKLTNDLAIIFNGQKLNNIEAESSEESDSDNIYNVDNSESDDYVPISDSEFELEKCVINKTNTEITNNKNTCTDSIKDDVCKIDESNDTSTVCPKSTVVDNDEVYDLLDKAYQNKNEDSNENKKKGVTNDDFKEYEKIVLEEVCKNHFDILPENWIEATHKSGMPVYLHKKTRVVTLARPYFLGPGNSMSHLAPLSAISCLQYQKGLESKEYIKNEPDFQVSKLGDMIIPNAKVETAQENIIKESLTHEELREYCKKLFK